ncbi:unnamed protein product, partial [Ectocarpus fasciculatus]
PSWASRLSFICKRAKTHSYIRSINISSIFFPSLEIGAHTPRTCCLVGAPRRPCASIYSSRCECIHAFASRTHPHSEWLTKHSNRVPHWALVRSIIPCWQT